MTTRALALVLSLAGAAYAVDHPEDARKLPLREVRGRESLSWSASTPPPVLPTASPIAVGATLVVRAESGESASFDLPASGWHVNGSGTTFKYENPLAPGGPSAVKSATVKSQGAVKIRANGTGITLDEATQGTVSIALTIGSDVYCSSCTTARQDRPRRYSATRCPAPAICTAPTTTLTTTSTTTSSFVPGVCGNGVAEEFEQCDGADPGICVGTPIPFPLGCNSPSSSGACTCCAASTCVLGISPVGPACCDDGICQDTTGVGMYRGGACIPPSCAQDADCHGYRCVGGTCCGDAGQLCGVAECCADSGATCSGVVWLGSSVCCRPAGASCSTFNECCSGSCVDGHCD